MELKKSEWEILSFKHTADDWVISFDPVKGKFYNSFLDLAFTEEELLRHPAFSVYLVRNRADDTLFLYDGKGQCNPK